MKSKSKEPTEFKMWLAQFLKEDGKILDALADADKYPEKRPYISNDRLGPKSKKSKMKNIRAPR